MSSTINHSKMFIKQYIKLLLLLLPMTGIIIIAEGQNINKPNKMGPLGTQVNTFSGNLFIPRNDFNIAARGFNLDVSFYYNSYNSFFNNGFGKGWGFIYDIKYKIDTANSRTIIWGDGREDNYTLSSGGSYVPPVGFFNTLSQYQPAKYVLTELDGSVFYFDNSTHKRITKMQDPNGNFINFNYNDTLLASIINGAGQSISFTYNVKGLLISVTDAIATPTRIYNYEYDGDGNLLKVTDPLGGTCKYTYLVNGPMKTLSDKNNNVVDIIYYNDYSVSELIGCNKRISFSYDTVSKLTVVTDHLAEGNNQVNKYKYQVSGNEVWLTAVSGNCCGFNTTFEFDAKGNKVKETDANGGVYLYTYDGKGNLLTMADPLGNTNTYTYSSTHNKITSFTDAKGNKFIITYNANGNVIQLKEPNNNIYTATYSANGDILTSTNPKGHTYTYAYDAYGNLTTETGPNGYTSTLTYDARGNVLSAIDAKGNKVTVEYDILDRLKKIIDPVNNAITLNYDAQGNPTTITNVNNETSTFGYDASNRVTSFTNAIGNQTVVNYDGMNNITNIKNVLGNNLSFGYDNRNRLVKATDAQNNVSTVQYDANGNMVGIQKPNGQLVQFSFDKINRVTKITDNNGERGSFVYDKNNNVTSFTDAAGATSTAVYDSLNRVVKVTDPLGYSASYTYDKNDNITSVTDRNGISKNYVYDSLDRVTSFTNNNGFTVSLGYDAVGNIVLAKDQNNQITNYTYDSINRLKSITFPDAKFIQLSYDKKSNVIAERLTDGTTVNYQYDSLSRLVSKLLPDGNVHTYSYDAMGKVISATNNSGTVTITYDALNRITSESFDGRTTRYGYNIAGRSQTTMYPDSTTIIKNFDLRNRLTSITKNNLVIVSYQYNNNNQVVSKTYGNGVITNLQYDFANRLNSISTAGGSIQNTNFTYDKERNKTAILRQSSPTLSEQFTYDNGHRITNYKMGISGGTPTINNSYTYDPVGNRLNANLSGSITNYTINNLNQLTGSSNSSQSIVFTYDNNGNLTYDGTYYKKYDADGRLLQDSASPSNKHIYAYDAFGRRVQKNVAGNIYKYSYSGLSQIEERNGTTNAILNSTVFTHFLSPVLNENNSISYYYHQNELNSVEAITNAAGSLTESYQYDVYGKPTILDAGGTTINSSLAGNRFGFTGQEYEKETNSYRFFYRNYSPATGTFNQRDPIGYGDEMGLYQYVSNNPANGIDILGLKPCPKNQFETANGNPEYSDPSGFSGQFWNATSASLGVTSVADQVNANWARSRSTKFIKGPFGLVATGMSIHNASGDLGYNYDTNNWAQNADAASNIVAGSGSFAIGAVGATEATAWGVGTVAAAVGEKGLASAAVSVLAAVAVAPEIAVAAGTTATVAGVYGIGNEISKVTTNKSIIEHSGDAGETWAKFNDHSVADLYEKYENATPKQRVMITKTLRRMEEKQRYYEWKKNLPQINIPPRVITINLKSDCPPHGPTGGTQRPPGPRGPGIIGFTFVNQSWDPNAIIGPEGEPTKRWVSVKDRLPYSITFENAIEASAPAKFVRITTPIEPKQDPATFELSSFGFNNQTFAVPANTASYYSRLDCRDSLGLFVDITAGYDQINNVAFWEFQSIDPLTLLPPPEANRGFLQLQDSTKPLYGHGFANFSIKPRQNSITLDTIGARAAIIFDLNPVIPTNIAMNTIDAFAPTSNMASLPANSNNPVTLSWGGVDDAGGCGLKFYTLYVSIDGINYNILSSYTTRTDTTFTGNENTRYYFFVLATDSVGNMETLRPGAIQNTFIGAPLPISWLYFKGKTEGKDNLIEWATINEQNSKSFIVERSLNGTNFTEIATLAAAGNSNTSKTYTLTDYRIDKLNSVYMYYRLKQVDLDGRFVYSNIIRLTYNQKDKIKSMVYPNPTEGMITISIGDAKLIGTTAAVYDENGKLLQMVKITANSQTLNLGKYVNGVYYIKLNNKEMLRVIKIQ